MTHAATIRYQSASSRNVKNFLDRFHGVNKGNAQSREIYLSKLTSQQDVLSGEISLEKVKHLIGVRKTDTAFDEQLKGVVNDVERHVKKLNKDKKLHKSASNEPAQAPSDQAPLVLVLDAPVVKAKKNKNKKK